MVAWTAPADILTHVDASKAQLCGSAQRFDGEVFIRIPARGMRQQLVPCEALRR